MTWLSPRLLPLHLLGAVLVAACVLMGLWQLGVYGAKQHVPSTHARSAGPVPLLEVWGPDAPFSPDVERRPVWVRGVFTGEQMLVQRGSGRYWTVAPLRVDGTSSSLLIVRGWSGRTPPPLPDGTVTFPAQLQPTEPTVGMFDERTGIYPSLSISALANIVRDDLFSGYAVTSATGINGGLDPVEPHDPDVSWTVGLRNLAYALQWWVFGLFTLFMWWRIIADAVADDAPEAADTVTE